MQKAAHYLQPIPKAYLGRESSDLSHDTYEASETSEASTSTCVPSHILTIRAGGITDIRIHQVNNTSRKKKLYRPKNLQFLITSKNFKTAPVNSVLFGVRMAAVRPRVGKNAMVRYGPHVAVNKPGMHTCKEDSVRMPWFGWIESLLPQQSASWTPQRRDTKDYRCRKKLATRTPQRRNADLLSKARSSSTLAVKKDSVDSFSTPLCHNCQVLALPSVSRSLERLPSDFRAALSTLLP